MKKLFTFFVVAILLASFSFVNARKNKLDLSRDIKKNDKYSSVKIDNTGTSSPIKGYEPNPVFINDSPNTVVIIGTGTNTQRQPFGMLWGYERDASLYTSTEIGNTGTISSLSWYVGTGCASSAPIVIYMKTTTATSLNLSAWSAMISGAATVYSGTVGFSTAGWATINLTTPFTYTSDNLVVMCETNYGGSGVNTYPVFRYTTSAVNSHQYWCTDTTPPTGNGTRNSLRPNIQINISTVTPMAYVSSTVTQSVTTPVYNASTNNQVIGIQVVTTGSSSPLNVSRLIFDVTQTGTTNINDIQNAKVFYTGASSNFATTTQFGNDVATIPSYPTTFIITSGIPQTLASGTNYFWLTYDITACAVMGDIIDAECTSINVSSSDLTPSPTTVAGTRMISSWSYGGPVAGYYFANSTPYAAGSPSQPTFHWFDTTGSTNLILNSATPAGAPVPFNSLNDGFYTVKLPSGMYFKFMGTDYATVYIGTNGYVSFGAGSTAYSVPSTGIPSASAPVNSIFGVFYDVRYDISTAFYNRLCYKFDDSENRMIITYQNCPTIGGGGMNNYVSYQIILNYSSEPPIDNSPLVIQFDDSQTGDGWKNVTAGQYFTNSLNYITGLQGSGAAGTALQYRFVYGGTEYSAGPLISSPVAIGYSSSNGTLPVELTAFSTNVNVRNVVLNWATAKEINNKCFEIERKTMNSEWIRISSLNGKGNTDSRTEYTFEDKKLQSGIFFYRLKQIDFNGNYKYYTPGNAIVIGIPAKYNMSQNYPNPFNPSTKIDFDLPYDSKVRLVIYDILGREMKNLIINEMKKAGYYTVDFNAFNMASGAYFYRMVANAVNGKDFVATKKMVIIK